jgi:hypothetical protein
MAENQLQTAIKFIYGVHTRVRRGERKTWISTPAHESAQFLHTKQS